MNKKGISLLILMITIVVMIILATAVVISVTNSIASTRKGEYESELKQLQDAVNSYYLLNNEPPYISKDNVMSNEDILTIVGDKNKSAFSGELTLNGDLSSTTWYKLDFSKIQVSHSNRGNLKNSNDIYVFTYPSLNVYYLHGETFNGEVYFSLSSKFSGIENIPNNDNVEDTSNVTTTTSSGISLEYSKAIWTNNIKAKIEVEVLADEELYIKITDKGAENKISTSFGKNILEFSNIQSLINKTATLNANITDVDKTNLQNASTQNKYIDIIKKKNGKMVGSARIPATNLDEVVPTITYNNYYETNGTYFENMLLTRFDLTDSISGIKDILHVYIKSDSVDISTMLQDNKLPEDYIKRNGQKINYAGGNGSIDVKTTKNTSYILAVIDNAGNMTQYYYNK